MFRIKSDTREFTIRDEQGEEYFDQCMRLLMGAKVESMDLDKILCMGAAQKDQKEKETAAAEEKAKPIHAVYMGPERKETTAEDRPVVTEETEHFFGGGVLRDPGNSRVLCI